MIKKFKEAPVAAVSMKNLNIPHDLWSAASTDLIQLFLNIFLVNKKKKSRLCLKIIIVSLVWSVYQAHCPQNPDPNR